MQGGGVVEDRCILVNKLVVDGVGQIQLPDLIRSEHVSAAHLHRRHAQSHFLQLGIRVVLRFQVRIAPRLTSLWFYTASVVALSDLLSPTAQIKH